MSIELGPILRFESRLVARRKSGYALRIATGFALWRCSRLTTGHLRRMYSVANPHRACKTSFSATITAGLVGLHFLVRILIAPIAAADGFSRKHIRTMMPSLLVPI